MTVTSTNQKVQFNGNGSTTVFAYNFKIFASSDLSVILRSAAGTETVQQLTTNYTVSGVGEASGGNVTMGTAPPSGTTLTILRVQPNLQGLDLVPNDPFPAGSMEDALDKLTFMVQTHDEEIGRSIKASKTNVIGDTEFTTSATDRANKLFSFDGSGDLQISQELGTYKGDWAASTVYAVRDLVKDTSTNNIFIAVTAHTSSGSQPLTTNTDAAKWALIVDAASATTSASSATTSASTATTKASEAAASATLASQWAIKTDGTVDGTNYSAKYWATQADVAAVAGKATEIGRLGTSDAVADMAILGTSDVVADMNTLGTAAIVEDMNLLGTSANVTAMGVLGTSDVVSDMNTLGTAAIVEDMNLLGTSANVTAMGVLGTSANVTAMAALAGSSSVEIPALTVKGGDAEDGNFFLIADNSDDAGDDWLIAAKHDPLKTLQITNNSGTTGGVVLTLTNSTNLTSESIAAFAGTVSVGNSVKFENTTVKSENTSSARTITLPDLDGTVALTSQLSGPGYQLPTAAASTLGGIKVGTNLSIDGSGVLSSTNTTDLVSDTSPQLGGALDVNGQDIVSTSNGAIELDPDGSGKVTFKGNATKGAGQFVLNCEQNSHGITIKGPPHSAAASYTLTLPNDDGSANEVLKTDGSGNLAWVAQSVADGAVTTAKIADSAVTTEKINADAVTNAKLADNSVDSEQYVDGSIDTAHIADANVTQAKIAGEAINESKLQVSNAPTNGYFLSAQSGNTGGLTWAAASGGDVVSDTSPQLGGNLESNGHDVLFADNDKALFGAGSDLQIYHDGSNSYIKEDGTGVLKIQAADLELLHADGSRGIRVTNDGGPVLYNNGSSKLTVNAAGVTIDGNITVTGTVDGRDIATNIPSSLGSAGQVLTVNSGGSAAEWAAASGGGADLYAANESSPSAQPSATGANAVAIGEAAVASGVDAVSIGDNSVASGLRSISLGGYTDSTADYAASIGAGAQALGEKSLAIYGEARYQRTTAIGLDSNSNVAIAGINGFSSGGAVALGGAFAGGVDSFAAAIANNTNSYGATAQNSLSMSAVSKASGSRAIAIGRYAVASATGAVSIGESNVASAANSSAYGIDAKATIIGQTARASGYFAADGDAQGSTFILRSDTTDATAEAMTTNNSTAGSTNQIVAASDTCITFSGTIVAMQNGAQSYGSWKIEGLLVNDGGTTTLANSAITVIQNASSWGLALSADNTNNALKIQVTGEASHNIRWVANVQTSEVTFA